jgi:hypothetical protein
MAELGPWMITAHNADQAEYLVRSRAEQRGIEISAVDVSGGDGGMWRVTATTTAEDQADVNAARLGEDTQLLHLDIRGVRQPPDTR